MYVFLTSGSKKSKIILKFSGENILYTLYSVRQLKKHKIRKKITSYAENIDSEVI